MYLNKSTYSRTGISTATTGSRRSNGSGQTVGTVLSCRTNRSRWPLHIQVKMLRFDHEAFKKFYYSILYSHVAQKAQQVQ